MSVTTVRLLPEIEQGLEAMADKLNRTKSWLINEAVRKYLAQHVAEDARWTDTLKAMESAAHGKVIASESVHAWLRSWGDTNELPPPTPTR